VSRAQIDSLKSALPDIRIREISHSVTEIRGDEPR
jgi:hypothetical protein